MVWVVKRGSAAYYCALNNNYTIECLPESEEDVAAEIIAESATAESASTSGWQTGDFEKIYKRYRWAFSNELKGAGKYIVTFKYTDGACMLCLSDALFVADDKAVAHFFERRTAGYNPSQIVYEITVPAGTETLELLALAKTSGGIESKGTVKVEFMGGDEEQGEENQDGNENQSGEENQNGNENQGGNEGEQTTAVNESVVDNLNIFAYGKTIVVENAKADIFVFDVNGRLVCKCLNRSISAEISITKPGVYVVKVGSVMELVFIE